MRRPLFAQRDPIAKTLSYISLRKAWRLRDKILREIVDSSNKFRLIWRYCVEGFKIFF